MMTASFQAADRLAAAASNQRARPVFDIAGALDSGGYAFETALCLVESQSPSLRPASVAAESRSERTLGREAPVLLSRMRSMARIVASVLDEIDAEEQRLLFAAARRVALELLAALEAATADPAGRFHPSAAMAEARRIAEALTGGAGRAEGLRDRRQAERERIN